MASLRIISPAKINLFLEVVCKRYDSYHEIKTFMAPVDLADTITLSLDKSGRISVETASKEIPSGKENLVYKACELFFDTVREKKRGVSISIEKKIPVAAGLGGGSSNAASVLLGLNKLCGGVCNDEVLAGIAGKVGCDVPFFLKKGPAVCVGRGDEVIPTKVRKGFHLVLGVPQKNALKDSPNGKTRAVYEGLNLGLTKDICNINMLLYALERCDLDKIGRSLFNRMEESVFQNNPELELVKKTLLRYGAKGALLSGSGPAVYGIVGNREDAAILKGRMLDKFGSGFQFFTVKTLF